jgi:hypothetical protein
MTACESREVSPSSDPSYFPLRKGLYHIYEVEEVTYTLGEPETLHYQLKTLVTDSIAGSNGQYTHILTRSRKMAGEETWEPLETWSVRKSAAEVIVSEEMFLSWFSRSLSIRIANGMAINTIA